MFSRDERASRGFSRFNHVLAGNRLQSISNRKWKGPKWHGPQRSSWFFVVCHSLATDQKQEAIDTAPEGRISAARVQFYTAEIILALVHLHDLGLMYRDLKVYNKQ